MCHSVVVLDLLFVFQELNPSCINVLLIRVYVWTISAVLSVRSKNIMLIKLQNVTSNLLITYTTATVCLQINHWCHFLTTFLCSLKFLKLLRVLSLMLFSRFDFKLHKISTLYKIQIAFTVCFALVMSLYMSVLILWKMICNVTPYHWIGR